MNSLKSLIKEYFKDTLYEAEVIMRSSRKRKLTIVTDNLRGVCGITVKFFQFEPTLEEHLQRMALDARKIDGIYSFIPYKTNKVVSRIYRDT